MPMWWRGRLNSGIVLVAVVLVAAGCSDESAATSTSAGSTTLPPSTSAPEAPTTEASTTTATSVASTTTVATPVPRSQIAFNQAADIYVMDVDGSNVINLTNSQSKDYDPEWSPDGTHIAFESIRDFPSDGYTAGTPTDIYSMAADGTDLLRLTSGPDSSHSPTWSPDGLNVAFVRNGDIYVTTSYGCCPYSLTDHPALDMRPAWSPAGTQIAFMSYRDDTYEIYVMDADGSDLTRLTSNLDDNVSPAWSPDGSRIAFAADRGRVNPYLGLEIRSSDVYVMDADGSNVIRLTTDPGDDASPAWSQDGTQITFISNRDSEGGVYNVFIMDADGSNPTNLTNNFFSDGFPSWSSTPSSIVARESLGLDLPAGFLLVDREGLWFVSADGSFLLLATGEVRAAFDDRAGGFVVQGDPFGDEPGAIYRLRAGSSDLEALVTPGEEEFVVLESVVEIDGVPTMLYTSSRWYSNPSTAVEVLVEVDLETGAQYAVTTTGGWEWGATRVSFGGNVYAIEGGGHEDMWLDFIDATSGLVLDYPTNPSTGGTDCSSDPCPFGSVISPDGLNLVFVRPGSADSAELINLFLGSGAESSYEISEVPFWLDFDGSIIAAHVWSPRSEMSDTTVYQLTNTGLVEHARLPGRATIARSVITAGAPVEVP